MNKPSPFDTLRDIAADLWRKLADNLRAVRVPGQAKADSNVPDPGTRRRNTFLLYLLFAVATLYLAQGYREVRQEEIPYSDFLKLVEEQKIDRAVVTDQVISGTLKPKSPGEEARSS